jgi:hypothetical protein
VVQALPSLQGAVLFVYTQPEVGLQVSSVQALWSSQPIVVPPQAPPEHTSLEVHALPSLQGTLLFTWVQPPPEHTSLVQPLPSSVQGALLFVCTQPEAGSQASSVQALPSSQLGAAPPTQFPPEHVSFVVQALPSLHGAVLFGCVQPPPEHTSLVQPLPSSLHGAVLAV